MNNASSPPTLIRRSRRVVNQSQQDRGRRLAAVKSITDPGYYARNGIKALGPTPEARRARASIMGRIGAAKVAGDRAKRLGLRVEALRYRQLQREGRKALARHDAAIRAAQAQ